MNRTDVVVSQSDVVNSVPGLDSWILPERFAYQDQTIIGHETRENHVDQVPI